MHAHTLNSHNSPHCTPCCRIGHSPSSNLACALFVSIHTIHTDPHRSHVSPRRKKSRPTHDLLFRARARPIVLPSCLHPKLFAAYISHLRLRLCLHFAFSGRNLSRSSSRPVSSSFSFSVLVAPRIGAHTPPLHGRNLLLLLSSTSERHNRTIPRVARPRLAARVSQLASISRLALVQCTHPRPRPALAVKLKLSLTQRHARPFSHRLPFPVSPSPTPSPLRFAVAPRITAQPHDLRTRPLAARSSARPFLGTRMPEPGRRSRSIDLFPPSRPPSIDPLGRYPTGQSPTRARARPRARAPDTGMDTTTRTRPRTCVHTHAIRYIRCRCRFRPFRLTDRPTGD